MNPRRLTTTAATLTCAAFALFNSACPKPAYAAKPDVTALAAQLAEARAEVSRANSERAALKVQIEKLSADDTRRGAVAAAQSAASARASAAAVNSARSAAQQVADSNDDIAYKLEELKAEELRLTSSRPANSVPVWLGVISAVVAVASTLGGVSIAWINTRNQLAQSAKVQQQQGTQIAQIHSLVNSDKTAAVERLLVATRANLALLLQLVDLKGDLSAEASGIVVATKTKIAELERELASRQKADAAAENMPGAANG